MCQRSGSPAGPEARGRGGERLTLTRRRRPGSGKARAGPSDSQTLIPGPWGAVEGFGQGSTGVRSLEFPSQRADGEGVGERKPNLGQLGPGGWPEEGQQLRWE